MIICKTRKELERMREAGRVVGQTLALMARLVQPGVKTIHLDREAEKFIRSKGATPTFKGYRGFPASLCVSINEQVVHGIPSQRRLKEGDIVSIDCGATLNGYIGDSAVTLPVGRCKPEIIALLQTTREALHAAIEAARIGHRLGDISQAVQSVAEPAGYGIVREYCGHGVGRQLHEAPQIPNVGIPGTGPKVTAGWSIAIEPMLNLGKSRVKELADGWTVVTQDGQPSAHFEHTVGVTPDGPVILTLP